MADLTETTRTLFQKPALPIWGSLANRCLKTRARARWRGSAWWMSAQTLSGWWSLTGPHGRPPISTTKRSCAPWGRAWPKPGICRPKGRMRALSAMRRFKKLADGMGLSELSVVATAAVRDASDGRAFCDEVQRETGLRIWVIDGEEEARLSAQGVLLGWPGAYGLVCDIGGSSMELAEISGGRVGRRVTSQLGPLKLRDIKGGAKARNAHIKDVMRGPAGTHGRPARPAVPGRRVMAGDCSHRHGTARLSATCSA